MGIKLLSKIELLDTNEILISGTSFLRRGGNNGNGVSLGVDAGCNSTLGADSVSIGQRANCGNVIGYNTVSIGSASCTTSGNAIAIGCAAVSSSLQTIAIGAGSAASNICAISIGHLSAANGTTSIVLGAGSTAIASCSISIGNCSLNEATATNSIAIGSLSKNDGTFSISIGSDSCTSGSTGTGNVAIGRKTCVVGDRAIAIGNYSDTLSNGVSIGSQGYAFNNATNVGYFSKARGNASTSLGWLSSTSIGATGSLAVGGRANAEACTSIAIGYQSDAIGIKSVAIGCFANAGSPDSIAIKGCSIGKCSITIGAGSYTSGFQTISIGNDSQIETANSISIGADHIVTGGTSNTVIGRTHNMFSSSSTILGGYNNTIGGGANSVSLIGFINQTITGTTYNNHVLVPKLAILDAPSAGASGDTVLVRDGNGLIKRVDQSGVTTSGGFFGNLTSIPSTPSTGVKLYSRNNLLSTVRIDGVERKLEEFRESSVTTTDATSTTIIPVTLETNSVYGIEFSVVGRQSDGSNRAYYRRSAAVYRNGAGAVIQGTIDDKVTKESNTSWNATIVVSGNDVQLRVVGDAATTINWVAKATTIKYV